MDLLLNWALHGAVLTGLVALAVRARPPMNAATRERVWWIALIAVTLMPAADLGTELARVGPASPLILERGPILVF
jgi:hypothetical protein